MPTITLEEMEALVAQLPPRDQLHLVAQISQRLSRALAPDTSGGEADQQAQRERLRLAEALLAEVSDIDDDSHGQFDAAEAIRRMRDERAGASCQKDA